MMHLFSQFMLAFVATMGFAIIFRVPVRHIPVCVIIGGLGWVTYLVTESSLDSPVIACFFGACMVGLCSAIATRIFKEAMANIGIETLMMAGAIAMGLLVIGAIIKVFRAIVTKTVSTLDNL